VEVCRDADRSVPRGRKIQDSRLDKPGHKREPITTLSLGPNDERHVTSKRKDDMIMFLQDSAGDTKYSCAGTEARKRR